MVSSPRPSSCLDLCPGRPLEEPSVNTNGLEQPAHLSPRIGCKARWGEEQPHHHVGVSMALANGGHVGNCEGFRMPARRNGEGRDRGRRPKPFKER
jgi:hypothetical protein